MEDKKVKASNELLNTLREREEQLRQITDNMLDVIMKLDNEGTIQYISPSYASIMGYNLEDRVRINVFETIHSDDVKRVISVFKTALKEPLKRAKVEYRARRADGSYLWLEAVGRALVDSRGAAAGVIVNIRDITERKRIEKALQESEAKYRTIFETTGNATVIVEDDATISLANQEFEKFSGYSKEEIEGKKSWLDFLAPGSREQSESYHCLRMDKQGTAPRQYELEAIAKKGEVRNILITVDIIPGTRKSVASFLDITERKQAEERLKQLSFHDAPTGLFNRSFFEEELLRLDTERQLPLSIILCDVNGLKLINDTLGHQKGDELLALAAAILKRNCRGEDIVCRWAGDEFAILLPQTDLLIANKVCDRIRRGCQETEQDPLPISFSLGAATKEHADQTVEIVFKDAEDIMYRDKLRDSRSTRFSMINFFQRALAEKSAETLEHVRRIQDIVVRIGNELGLSRREQEELDILAALHDIGQIAIPGALLTKPCFLTADEWVLIKRHPEVGESIARSLPDLAAVADAIQSHHEFWDGTGYPKGLKGESIPLYSRMLTIADAYDVMTNGRPYKKAISHEEALKEIRKCAGTQFDPELVALFTATVAS